MSRHFEVAAANSVFVSCIIVVGIDRGYLSARLTKEDRGNARVLQLKIQLDAAKLNKKNFIDSPNFTIFEDVRSLLIPYEGCK